MGTVLVAEDSKTIRTIINWLFKGSGHTLKNVSSGQEAMGYLHEQRPDLLILDYTLPDQDAYELCKNVKSNPTTSGVAVLMLGGRFASFDESKAKASGADDFIMKPFLTDDFLGKVDELIAKAIEGQISGLAAEAPKPAPPTPAPAPAAPESRGRFQFPSRGGQQPSPPQPQAAQSAPNEPKPQKRFSFPSKNEPQRPQAPAPRQPQPAQAQRQPQPPQRQPQPPQRQPQPPTPQRAPEPKTPASPTLPMGGGDATPASGLKPVSAQPVEIDPAVLRVEVQKAVKELLPSIVRGVLKELITKEVTPHLQKWVENKVESLVRRRSR